MIIKQGLFKTKNNLFINVDINGSFNIGRKEFGDAFMPTNKKISIKPI